MINFASNSLVMNLSLFAAGALAIWIAGTKLEHYADRIAEMTKLGKAFLGMALLATATSLPEIATSLTATLSGHVDMAVHNLLGGVIMQTAVLAIADVTAGRRALTSKAPHFALLISGVGLIVVLGTALVGISVSHIALDRLSAAQSNMVVMVWAAALVTAFILMLFLTKWSQTHPGWRPEPMGGEKFDTPATSSQRKEQHSLRRRVTRRLVNA